MYGPDYAFEINDGGIEKTTTGDHKGRPFLKELYRAPRKEES